MLTYYLTLRASGVPIRFGTVFGMALRRSLTKDLMFAIVMNHKSSLGWPISDLEAHSIAGGNTADLVNAGIILKAAKVPVDRRDLIAADLARLPVLELAQAFVDLRETYGADLSFREMVERSAEGKDVLTAIRDGTFLPRSHQAGWLVRVELGPMTGKELLERLRDGQIPDDAQVRDPDRGDWISLATAVRRVQTNGGSSPSCGTMRPSTTGPG